MRMPGIYWVRLNGAWLTAEWFDDKWIAVLGMEGEYSDEDFSAVSERPLQEPQG